MFNQLKNLFKKEESKSIAELMKPLDTLEKKPVPIEIALQVQGNEQLNNFNIGSLRASSQCGYTMDAMILSQFIPEAKDDKFIKEIIEHFEKNFLAGRGRRFGLTMDNHVFINEYYLKKYGIKRKIHFTPHSGTIADIIAALNKGYAIGCAGMMTSHGHFMVIIGYSEIRKSFLMHDPYKRFDFDAKRYTNESGLNVYYPIDKFMPYLVASSLAASGNTKKGIRFYYIGDKINE
jgi:hypothetical protein